MAENGDISRVKRVREKEKYKRSERMREREIKWNANIQKWFIAMHTSNSCFTMIALKFKMKERCRAEN